MQRFRALIIVDVAGEDHVHAAFFKRGLQQADFLFKSQGDAQDYLKAGDVLSEDGRYVVRVEIDGQHYGEYPFTVKGGVIQLQGKQIREKTDSMDYIVDYLSGGRYTSWWLPRTLK